MITKAYNVRMNKKREHSAAVGGIFNLSADRVTQGIVRNDI